MRAIPWYLWLIVAGIVALATLQRPYGYYTFTRIVVCGFCSYLAYLAWNETPQAQGWAIALSITAILFNPFVPMHLDRATWFWFDMAAAVFIAAHLFLVRLRKVEEA